MRIDIEDVRRIMEERAVIDRLPLKEIEWYEDGKQVEVDAATLEHWRFVGLSNIDFILTSAYKGKVAEAF